MEGTLKKVKKVLGEAKKVDPRVYAIALKSRRTAGRHSCQGGEVNDLLDEIAHLAEDGNKLSRAGCAAELKQIILQLRAIHINALKKCKYLYYI